MDKKDFFQKEASEINRKDIINSLVSDANEVLNEKYLWVSKICDNEENRNNSFHTKAEILLGIHIGFISLLLGGSFFSIFSEFIKNNLGMLFTGFIIIFIFGSPLFGIFYSLKVVGIPSFINVIDPTLSLKPYKSKEDWLKEVIGDTLMVYKKNLKIIESNAFYTRLSFDFLLIAIFSAISAVIVMKSFSLAEQQIVLNNLIYGGIIGIIFFLIVKYYLINKPRGYK
ncbi:MAG: hypothetical protein DIAAKJNI_00441 [Candidatus Argoarchaeum ethanivorans]|uniref:Uncharacterized protein n=1 Tax=Candidatus Argoarchaeum ethanivorans TaxID=2608793 RepID=A0A811TEC2_9EURY|nr:MAG: hypothetical protein DIAAKJNI_00441 [Candidatus Argoarchaeum ethanivorans]